MALLPWNKAQDATKKIVIFFSFSVFERYFSKRLKHQFVCLYSVIKSLASHKFPIFWNVSGESLGRNRFATFQLINALIYGTNKTSPFLLDRVFLVKGDDHKLITKTISRKMTENISRVITGSQTAYLRNRSISDNLRLVAMANKIAKKDQRLNGLLIALDAKKAFDFVDHQYIRDVLTKIGLADMVRIFDLLYAENKVDIMLNIKICKGYCIQWSQKGRRPELQTIYTSYGTTYPKHWGKSKHRKTTVREIWHQLS